MDDPAFLAPAIAAIVAFIPIARAVTPWRRQDGESWFGYYLRVWWLPATSALIAAAGVARGLDMTDEDRFGLGGYIAAVVLVCLFALATVNRQRERGY